LNFNSEQQLGEGAYSQVYKVKRISDGKEYALKKVGNNHLNKSNQSIGKDDFPFRKRKAERS
jgi:serine/threonine protein kinase